jgi:hypothetical protein
MSYIKKSSKLSMFKNLEVQTHIPWVAREEMSIFIKIYSLLSRKGCGRETTV